MSTLLIIFVELNVNIYWQEPTDIVNMRVGPRDHFHLSIVIRYKAKKGYQPKLVRGTDSFG